MANFIVSYDLNGPYPTHNQIDQHICGLRPVFVTARILESVWYIAGPTTDVALRDYLLQVMSPNDRVVVARTPAIAWYNLLVSNQPLKQAFENLPLAA